VLWQVDIPRLTALNAQWRRLPPPAIQLARIAAFLGFKPADPPPAAPAGAAQEPSSDDMQALLAMMPTTTLPPVMSSEEYLRRKHGQQ
jgi:hypothetical protein